jgi:hypothetical protein
MKSAWIAVLALALEGCPGVTDATDEELSLSGKWSGSMTLSIGGQTGSVVQLLELAQSGETVTGSETYQGDTYSRRVQGSLVDATLTLVMTSPQKPQDDCHLYPWTWTYMASGGSLTLNSVSGMDCEGNGIGGHKRLTPVSGGSGKLSKQ